jgi:hypothetical protein
MNQESDEKKLDTSNSNFKERESMNADDTRGIRYALENKYGLRVVTHTQIMIVSTLIKHPGIRPAAVANLLGKSIGTSPSAVFKAFNKLKEFDVIDESNHITLKAADMIPKVNGERIAYPLVSFVRERVLPEDASRYEWTHIAAFIAKQPNPIAMCEALKKIIDPVEQLSMLYEMQNGLAFCSIMANDVSQWADMKGNIQFLQSMADLFKKAGIK